MHTIFLAAALLASSPACGDEVRAPGGGLSLVLNIPAFRLDVEDGAGERRSYTVAVGGRRFRTPVGRYQVSSVELNPWWHPPASRWARREKVAPPGPDNPMGRAKLNFHELYFLHGTPAEESLGSAASHGCVRMANRDVLALARRVMALARPDVSPAELDAAATDRRTRRYVLRTPIPLEIGYRTAEVRHGALELHPDVYGRERTPLRARALDALRRAGVREDLVDPERLDSAVRAGRRRHVHVALDQLVRRLPLSHRAAADELAASRARPAPRTPCTARDDPRNVMLVFGLRARILEGASCLPLARAAPGRSATVPNAMSTHPRSFQILLVEDDPEQVRLTREAFRRGKVLNHLSVAAGGAEALALLRGGGAHGEPAKPDLLLVDVRLLRRDGWGVLDEIRADPSRRDLPVVLVASSTEEEEDCRGRVPLPGCCVTKPVDLDQCVRIVASVKDLWLEIVTLTAEAV